MLRMILFIFPQGYDREEVFVGGGLRTYSSVASVPSYGSSQCMPHRFFFFPKKVLCVKLLLVFLSCLFFVLRTFFYGGAFVDYAPYIDCYCASC